LYDKGYECTDGDNYQFVKKISETEYIVIDGNKVHDIDLDDYTDTEIRDYVSGYYPSLEDLKEQYTEEFCN
jgi:hypothetical protein